VLTLRDQTNKTIDLTLWGAEAEKTGTWDGQPVLAIKNVRVSDFGGRTLSTGFDSRIFVNPENNDDAVRLRQWFMAEGQHQAADSMSKQGQFSGRDNGLRTSFMELRDFKPGSAANQKGEFFNVRGTVVYTRADFSKPPWYLACPREQCKKKKVNPENDGNYFCSTCNTKTTTPVPRYILSVLASDHSGGQWLTAFHEQAEMLLGGVKAQDAKALQESGREEEFKSIFADANFKMWTFRVRAKEEEARGPGENSGGEMRMRCHIVSCQPVNYKAESTRLLASLDGFFNPQQQQQQPQQQQQGRYQQQQSGQQQAQQGWGGSSSSSSSSSYY